MTMHSAFSLWTHCQTVTPDNCDTVFANRKYRYVYNFFSLSCIYISPPHRFALDVTDCHHGSGGACETEYTGQSFEIFSHYIHCPFGVFAEAPPTPPLNITTVWPRAYVKAFGWEPKFKSVSLCVIDPLHRLAPCARNENITCPRRGCTWGEDDPTLRPDGTPTRQEIWNDGLTPAGINLGVEVYGNLLSFLLFNFQPLDQIVVDALLLFGDREETQIQTTYP